MPLTRQQKEQRVADMKTHVASAVSAVFVTFDAINVTDMMELRNQLAAAGNQMQVIPKRLLKLVMVKAKIDFDPTQHENQMAVVWGDDAVSPAKVLKEFTKQHQTMRLISGTLEDKLLSETEVNALANIPSRDQLLGQLANVLSGSSRGLVMALAGVPRNTVYALRAIADNKANSPVFKH